MFSMLNALDSNKDRLFDTLKPSSPFAFDADVAHVFEDMIRRSVPGYALTLEMIGVMTAHYAQTDSDCYDLGCSLGGASLAMAQGIDKKHCEIIAVDNSLPMLEKAQTALKGLKDKHLAPVHWVCADILTLRMSNASVVVMNFTLQFVPEQQKNKALKTIFSGMNTGGIFILSEKIRFESAQEEQCLQKLHHDFKRSQGYSDLEISQKRNALEEVLRPDSLQVHQARLQAAGFTRTVVWFQCFNFVSLLAFK